MTTATRIERSHDASGAGFATQLVVKNVPSAGLQIHGALGGTPEQRHCVEGVFRGDVPVPLFTEIFIQFPTPYIEAVLEKTANLFVAAPELLDTLKELCEIVEGLIGSDAGRDIDQFTTQPARAIIAKVEGRPAASASP